MENKEYNIGDGILFTYKEHTVEMGTIEKIKGKRHKKYLVITAAFMRFPPYYYWVKERKIIRKTEK